MDPVHLCPTHPGRSGRQKTQTRHVAVHRPSFAFPLTLCSISIALITDLEKHLLLGQGRGTDESSRTQMARPCGLGWKTVPTPILGCFSWRPGTAERFQAPCASEVEGGLASPATHRPFQSGAVNALTNKMNLLIRANRKTKKEAETIIPVCKSHCELVLLDPVTLQASHFPEGGDPPCLGDTHTLVSCWQAKEVTGNQPNTEK